MFVEALRAQEFTLRSTSVPLCLCGSLIYLPSSSRQRQSGGAGLRIGLGICRAPRDNGAATARAAMSREESHAVSRLQLGWHRRGRTGAPARGARGPPVSCSAYSDDVLKPLADAEAGHVQRIAVRRVALRTRAKAITCRIIAALPYRVWPLASSIIRRIWPGMRDT